MVGDTLFWNFFNDFFLSSQLVVHRIFKSFFRRVFNLEFSHFCSFHILQIQSWN